MVVERRAEGGGVGEFKVFPNLPFNSLLYDKDFPLTTCRKIALVGGTTLPFPTRLGSAGFLGVKIVTTSPPD
jgi:hypothetical protein